MSHCPECQGSVSDRGECMTALCAAFGKTPTERLAEQIQELAEQIQELKARLDRHHAKLDEFGLRVAEHYRRLLP